MSSGPARILFLLPSFEVGGTERQLCYLVEGLDCSRFEPYVFVARDGPLRGRFEAAGAVVLAPPESSRSRVARLALLWREMRRRRIAVAHSFLWGWQLWDLAVAKAAGATFLSSRRDMALWMRRAGWKSRLYRRASRVVVANSHAAARVLLDREAYPPHKVRVIWNGVPEPEGDAPWPSDAPPRWEGETVILYVATIKEGKGHIELIEAVEGLAREGPAWRLYLAGRDQSQGRVPARMAASPARDRIHWLGERREAAALMAHADIFAMPSIQEGFSNALGEAMARGVPCVAARAGGNPELISSPEVGILTEPGDPVGLRKALANLVGDAALRGRLGSNAKRYVRECLSCQRMVEQFEALYDEILGADH